MNVKILDPERRSEVPLPQIPVPDRDAITWVIEDEDGICASMSVVRVVHLESLWIRPDKRGNAGIVRSLLNRVVGTVKSFGSSWVIGTGESPEVESFIKRLGGKPVNTTSYIIPIGD